MNAPAAWRRLVGDDGGERSWLPIERTFAAGNCVCVLVVEAVVVGDLEVFLETSPGFRRVAIEYCQVPTVVCRKKKD